MSEGILGNATGGFGFPRTYIIADENGNEVTGVYVESETVFTANAAEDIRAGKIAATDVGVVTGEAIIPNYETTSGKKVVAAGSQFQLTTLKTHDKYDYTELQCIICPYNLSMNTSVGAEKVVIGDNVYNANSVDIVSTISKNTSDQTVNFNLTNTTEVPYIIRYFTYKKLYGE